MTIQTVIFASIFHRLSWIGYLGLVLGVIVLGVWANGMYWLWSEKDPARSEKTIRYFGLVVLFGIVLFVVLWFDSVYNHGWVTANGRLYLKITHSEYITLAWGLLSGTVVSGPLFLISWHMKRRREMHALDEMLKMYRVLVEEYGEERASELMDRAGHRKRYTDVHHDW